MESHKEELRRWSLGGQKDREEREEICVDEEGRAGGGWR